MRRTLYLVLLALTLLFISGCNLLQRQALPTTKTSVGSVGFSIDLSQLLKSSLTSGVKSLTITAVKVTLTRDGYNPIQKDLTIANNQATGQVDDLAEGYWKVNVGVWQNSTPLYQGDVDVNIVAGLTTTCTILLDEVTQEPTTGSLSFNVGVNPLPGYKPIYHAVSKVLVDEIRSFLYILDSSANLIKVYDENLNFIRDLVPPSTPLSICFSIDKTGLLLGYPSGSVYYLDVTTGISTKLCETTMQAEHLLAFSSNFILINDDSVYKTVDTTTGRTISSKDGWYDIAEELIWSPGNKTAYFHTNGISPSDLIRISLDATTGEIISIRDSYYHGDFGLGTPIRVISNGTRVVTSSGNLFTCSSIEEQDLRYVGSLDFSYIDLTCDDTNKLIYAIDRAGKNLIISSMVDYFRRSTVEIKGNGRYVYNTTNNIILMTEYQGRYYIKSFAKANLGV